jgi:hypothetical protein
MYKIKLLAAFIIIGILLSSELYSQKFSVSKIDTRQFPTLKVNFEALDKYGNVYENLDVSDFNVWDGNNVPPSKITIDCKDTTKQRPVLVIFVLDQSESMREDNGSGTPWSWVTYAVDEFMRVLNMNDGSKVAVITFAFNSYLGCPFTTDRQQVLDSLSKVNIGGGTDYNFPFLATNNITVQNLFNNEDPYLEKRRIVIFLSDGLPSSTRTVEEEKIIKILDDNGITLYGIIINEDVPQSLRTIAESTSPNENDKMTHTARSRDDLKNIFKNIALDHDPLKICSLLWETDLRCQFDRTAQITLKEDIGILRPEMKSAILEYKAPIEEVSLSEIYLDFGNPEPGETLTKDLTITAGFPHYECTGFSISNQQRFKVIDWDVDSPGDQNFTRFTLQEGESRTIRVQFSQGAYIEFFEDELILQGIPCPVFVPLTAGIPALQIVYPNGGEKLSKCEETMIRWTGVAPDIPVKLYYGDGENWDPIAYTASGLEHSWLPEKEGEFKIRGEISGEDLYVSCAQKAGGLDNDAARSITISDDGRYAFVTGYYTIQANFGEDGDKQFHNDKNRTEIFVAKYRTADCSLVAVESYGGKGMDSANAIVYAQNPNGDGTPFVYVSGAIEQGARFDYHELDIPYENMSYFFLAKINANDLSVESIDFYGAKPLESDINCWGTDLGYDRYRNAVVADLRIKYDQEPNSRPLRFRYDAGTMERNENGYGGTNSGTIVYDALGNRYDCGTFFEKISFFDIDLVAYGRNDAYFRKWTKVQDVPPSSDESDDFFLVDSSNVSLSSNSIQIGDEIVEETNTVIIEDLICNENAIPMEVESISSSDDDEVYVLSVNPQIIEPGECADVEIAFTPKEIGIRRVTLTINASCARPEKLTVFGKGVCGARADSLVDFGTIAVGKTETIRRDMIFENLNPFDLKSFNMKILGTDADQFKLISAIPQTVGKYGVVSAEIEFKPTTEGPKEAYLQYFMPTFCDLEPKTILIGEGSPIALGVNNIDFGLQRVLIPKDTFIVVRNESEKEISIDNIEFIENEDNAFAIVGSSTFDIDASSEREVNIRFTPTEEKVYNARFKVYYNSIAERENTLSGTGFLPAIQTNYVCGDPIIEGETTFNTLTIKNISEYGQMIISDAVFTNSNEYSWVGDSPMGDILSPQEEKEYEISFAPNGLGIRTGSIEITADTKLSADENNLNETHLIEQNCEALGIRFTKEVDFGNILACEEISREITLINYNGSTPVELYDLVINGKDADYFTLELPDERTFMPGDTLNIIVIISPDQDREFTATLTISNSIDYDITIPLSANARYIELYSTKPKIDVIMEQSLHFDIPVILKIPQVENEITELTIRSKYNINTLQYKSFNNSNNDYEWADDPSVSGSVDMIGSGLFTSPYEGEVFTQEFSVFLSDIKETDIILESIHSLCVSPEYFGTSVEMKGCFIDGRLIIPSETEYFISASPSPAESTTELFYGIGIASFTIIELYNSVGKLVDTIKQDYKEQGIYSEVIDLGRYSVGLYFVRIQSGPYVETIPLIINR